MLRFERSAAFGRTTKAGCLADQPRIPLSNFQQPGDSTVSGPVRVVHFEQQLYALDR